ncbi:unnamed protein product [Schistosoma margrebowiei]|uniref:Uncharacterized protein n=1 Tax=Schistosoma margrebowiei TaxID=48269 RepID=A0A183ME62_9TREM|nr:unnamed protein product [Schistosoma margrebowiei]
MVVGGIRQETLDPGLVLLGTHQQGVPVILKELVLPDGFDPVSPNFTLINLNTTIPLGLEYSDYILKSILDQITLSLST